jgi:hypothetical protein
MNFDPVVQFKPWEKVLFAAILAGAGAWVLALSFHMIRYELTKSAPVAQSCKRVVV